MKHLRNDIAVLTLTNAVALSDRVNTVCLPQGGQQVPMGTKCYITRIPGRFLNYRHALCAKSPACLEFFSNRIDRITFLEA